MPAIAEEEAEPLAAIDNENDEDEDADDVPEIEADEDTEIDPAIARD